MERRIKPHTKELIMEEHYRPLPECLTIKESEIDGLGLFATEDISRKEILGISHRYNRNDLHRTPLGGFYNHSETPNCCKKRIGNAYFLLTERDIKAGEEITVKYTFYDPTND